jgi:1-phosphatidylinositol phosphodiesterase
MRLRVLVYSRYPGVTFQQRFNTYYSERTNLWNLTSEIPVLRDVRGKIVLFRRFQLDTNQPALPLPQNPGINAFNDFPDNDTGTIDGPPKLIIQDKFSQTISKAAKWTAVQQLLNQASGDQGSDVLYVNFASAAGTAPVDFPLSVANYINPRLINYFNGKRGRFGIVPMDFQTRELNTLIIQTNGG